MNKTAILNMGFNNIKSIFNLSNKLSDTYVFSNLNDFKVNTKTLILPGNGNFGKGMEILNDRNLVQFIRNLSQEIKIVGICLGMQLLMDRSEEAPSDEGLSLISGSVVKIGKNDNYNNPLLGWYDTKLKTQNKLYKFDGSYFYNNNFVIDPIKKDLIHGYLDDLPVFIIKNKIFGIQFHPELSKNLGFKFFKNIIES